MCVCERERERAINYIFLNFKVILWPSPPPHPDPASCCRWKLRCEVHGLKSTWNVGRYSNETLMRAQSPKKECHLEIVMGGCEEQANEKSGQYTARWMVSPWQTVFWPSPSSFPGAALGKEGEVSPGLSGCLRVCPPQARACPPGLKKHQAALERAVQEDEGPPLLFTGLGGLGKAFYKLASQTFVVLSWNVKVLLSFPWNWSRL